MPNLEFVFRFGYRVTQRFNQVPQLIETTVNIADDVERAVFGFFVVPEYMPLDDDIVDVFNAIEDMDMGKAFEFA